MLKLLPNGHFCRWSPKIEGNNKHLKAGCKGEAEWNIEGLGKTKLAVTCWASQCVLLYCISQHTKREIICKRNLFVWCQHVHTLDLIRSVLKVQIVDSPGSDRVLFTLGSFDSWHMTCSPQIGKCIWVGRYSKIFWPTVFVIIIHSPNSTFVSSLSEIDYLNWTVWPPTSFRHRQTLLMDHHWSTNMWIRACFCH